MENDRRVLSEFSHQVAEQLGFPIEAFGSNKNLCASSQKLADWKSIYLGQLFSNSFLRLSCYLKQALNVEDQGTISSGFYTLTLQAWLNLPL